LRTFSQILPKFPQILPGFFSDQKFWGCGFTPCTPPPTPVIWEILNEGYRASKISYKILLKDICCIGYPTKRTWTWN